MQKVRSISSREIRTASSAITRPANTTAYAAGDAISGSDDGHHTFLDLTRAGIMSGKILQAQLQSNDAVATPPDAELWLFASNITDTADNDAFAPSDANMGNLIGIIDFPTGSFYVGTSGASGNQVCQATPNLSYKGGIAEATGVAIYGQLVVRNAYVPISGEILTVKLVVEAD